MGGDARLVLHSYIRFTIVHHHNVLRPNIKLPLADNQAIHMLHAVLSHSFALSLVRTLL